MGDFPFPCQASDFIAVRCYGLLAILYTSLQCKTSCALLCWQSISVRFVELRADAIRYYGFSALLALHFNCLPTIARLSLLGTALLAMLSCARHYSAVRPVRANTGCAIRFVGLRFSAARSNAVLAMLHYFLAPTTSISSRLI